jgi:hypothetical protein
MTIKPSGTPTPPLINRIIVGTIAVIAGLYVIKDAGKDFEFIKFEPHSPEEVERRKREHVKFSMKTLETRTLEYTPEAKERLRKLVEDQNGEKADSGEKTEGKNGETK